MVHNRKAHLKIDLGQFFIRFDSDSSDGTRKNYSDTPCLKIDFTFSLRGSPLDFYHDPQREIFLKHSEEHGASHKTIF